MAMTFRAQSQGALDQCKLLASQKCQHRQQSWPPQHWPLLHQPSSSGAEMFLGEGRADRREELGGGREVQTREGVEPRCIKPPFLLLEPQATVSFSIASLRFLMALLLPCLIASF